MAYGLGYGGAVNNTNYRTSYTNNFLYTDGYGFPVGNLDSNGNRPVKIYSVGTDWSTGATYSAINYNGTITGGGAVVNGVGGPFRHMTGHGAGTLGAGRNTGNGLAMVDSADGDVVTGGICGSFTWGTAPAAPAMLDATPGPGGSITVRFSGSGDTGGVGITGWVLAYATNSGFSSPTVIASSGTSTLNLTPGTTYWFKAAGQNDVTTSAGSWGGWSGSISATAVGVPSAPTSLTGTRSTTIPNAINLSWTAPGTTGGTITGYKIYNSGTLVATTSGTGTTSTVTGLVRGGSNSFTVRARNAYGDANGSESPDSNTFVLTSEGVPSEPRTPNAVASGVTPGKITVTWTAPSYLGIGGLTGYDVYLSTGTLLGSVGSGVLTYDALGLTPGLTYGFYIKAKNAITAASGTPGDQSATAYATALGDPPAPTGVTLTPSTTVPGRLTLAWTYPAIGVVAVTGYTIYQGVAPDGVKLDVTKTMSYAIDGLTPGTSYSFYVKSRNTVTDPVGSDGGPSSVTVTATPTATANQTVPNIASAVVNNTNTSFNGTISVSATTATTFTYTKTGANFPQTAIPALGTTLNNTNTALNGTYTVAVPNVTTITYAKAWPNFTSAASGGLLLDVTNSDLNGTYAVTAADSFNKTVSYSKVRANIPSVAATGKITNATNSTFNGTGFTITAITLNTFSYVKAATNVTEISATGIAINATNRDYYNGTFTVKEIPAYNKFTYSRVV